MARLLAAIERYAERLRGGPADALLGPPTLSIGIIEGGTSVNTVPDRCRVEVDRRLVGGEEPDAVQQQVADFLTKEAGIDFPFEMTPPWIRERG